MKKLQATIENTGKTNKYTVLLPNGEKFTFNSKKENIESVQLQFNKDGSIDVASKGKLVTTQKGMDEFYNAMRNNKYYAETYGVLVEKHEVALLEYVEELVEEAEQEEAKPAVQEEAKPAAAKPAKTAKAKTVIINCVDCDAEREIKVQDAFQVKRCKECQKKHRNRLAAERRRQKRATAKN